MSDPLDTAQCSKCGVTENINLLDGVVTYDGRDTGYLGCIKCYAALTNEAGNPNSTWSPLSIADIKSSIAPELKLYYEGWRE